MSRLIGPGRSAIQSTGKADFGTLVQRVPLSGSASVTVPSLAICAKVVAVGAGGNAYNPNPAGSSAYGGGGGAYAKSWIAVVPGELLDATIDNSQIGAGLNGGSASLARAGATLLLAAGGFGASVFGPGLGGQVANSIGTITRNGGTGGNSSPASPVPSNPEATNLFLGQGGIPASDYGDFDAINIGKWGAYYSGRSGGPGGGGSVYLALNNPRIWSYMWPGPGAMVIEFYNYWTQQ